MKTSLPPRKACLSFSGAFKGSFAEVVSWFCQRLRETDWLWILKTDSKCFLLAVDKTDEQDFWIQRCSCSARLLNHKSDMNSAICHQQRKQMESPPCTTSVPSAGTFNRNTFLSYTSSSSSSSLHQHSSSTLPHQSSSHAHTSPHYSTSSLPHKHTSLSLGQQSSPSIHRSSRSRTSCIPPTPAPTAPLPVCPSPQTGIRYVSPSCQDPHAHLQGHSNR